MNLVWGTILEPDEDRWLASVDGRSGASTAIAYADLIGMIEIGDRVLLNTTAVDLGLGTGGDHFIVSRLAPDSIPEGIAMTDESGGHLMKLRYTPLQRDVLCVEAPEARTHAIMAKASSLEGIPVVCCSLHSQMPVVAAAIKATANHLRVGYVMTDQAALHMGYSRLVKRCLEEELLDTTVSTGQAIGGMLEAVNLYSGLLAGCHVGGCDVLICSIGPGLAGSATPYGHGGIAQGEAINAVASLGGRPIAVLRASFADNRDRHWGVSHHSLTALESIALAPAIIAVPHLVDSDKKVYIEQQIDGLSCTVRHQAVFFDKVVFNQSDLKSIRVTTMGRSYEDDLVFFEAASAAGVLATQIGLSVVDEAARGYYDGQDSAMFASCNDYSEAIAEATNGKDNDLGANAMGCRPNACTSCPATCPSGARTNEPVPDNSTLSSISSEDTGQIPERPVSTDKR